MFKAGIIAVAVCAAAAGTAFWFKTGFLGSCFDRHAAHPRTTRQSALEGTSCPRSPGPILIRNAATRVQITHACRCRCRECGAGGSEAPSGQALSEQDDDARLRRSGSSHPPACWESSASSRFPVCCGLSISGSPVTHMIVARPLFSMRARDCTDSIEWPLLA
jgi:hypothetical protein